MFEITVVLVSLTAVCMAVPSMRLWAVLGLGLLFLLYPLLSLALLILGGAAVYFTHFHNRSNSNDNVPRLPD